MIAILGVKDMLSWALFVLKMKALKIAKYPQQSVKILRVNVMSIPV